jgi:hypothetical protein
MERTWPKRKSPPGFLPTGSVSPHTNLHDPDFRRVAPGAHDVVQAGGAEARPHGRSRSETGKSGFAAVENAGRRPIVFHVRVAGADGGFVDAPAARRSNLSGDRGFGCLELRALPSQSTDLVTSSRYKPKLVRYT